MRVRCVNILLCALLTLVLAIPSLSLAKPASTLSPSESDGTWTLALYVDADCNLEMYWEDPSLGYLLNIPESEGLNIVAIVDHLSYDGVERIEIEGDHYEVMELYPEMNFGDGATFSWFLTEVTTHYPADHLAVIPWNHGSAWKGFCWDDSSDGDHITLVEMGQAIMDAGVYIDILAFDACACSSIEMIYQAAKTDLAELLVASEELVAGDGFPYDLMFTPVALDPSRTPDEVALDMLAGWKASYEPLPWAWYSCLSVVDVLEVSQSIDTITAWVDQMREGLPDYTVSYRMALRDSYYVTAGSHYQVDMIDLGRHLLDDPALADDVELLATTQAMMDLISGAVKGIYNTDTTAAAGGVSIYWGSHNQAWRTGMETYCALEFAQDTGWGQFLVDYNAFTCGWMRIGK